MQVDFADYKWNGDGSIWYKEQVMMQNDLIFPLFKEFFKKNKIDTIVEIGTAYAGFSLFLEDLTKEYGTKIVSYDIMPIEDMPYHSSAPDRKIERSIHVINSSVDYRIKNTYTPEVIQEVSDIIKSGGRCAVFCDGGDKPKEFNIYSDHLKQGDFILAHDYGTSIQYYSDNIQGKYWNWLECRFEQIQDQFYKNNIELYYPEYFEKAAWFCGIKK